MPPFRKKYIYKNIEPCQKKNNCTSVTQFHLILTAVSLPPHRPPFSLQLASEPPTQLPCAAAGASWRIRTPCDGAWHPSRPNFPSPPPPNHSTAWLRRREPPTVPPITPCFPTRSGGQRPLADARAVWAAASTAQRPLPRAPRCDGDTPVGIFWWQRPATGARRAARGDPAASRARPDGRRSSRSGFRGAPRILLCHVRLPSLPPRSALVALLDWQRR